MRIDTQVCLVSTQPTANLTPLLDPELKPREAVLMVSPNMQLRADWLEAVLLPRGVRVERRNLADAYDLKDLRDQLLNLAAERENETIVLNVTGGTKLMAIAAYEVFFVADKPIFYVHPELDRLIWLHPKGLPDRDLADRLKLDPFLGAHGALLAERPPGYGMPENLRNLAHALVERVNEYSGALASLNRAAAEAINTLVSRPHEVELQRGSFSELVDWFEAEGLLTVADDCLHFADEEARFFANGGWLEQYVYAVVQDLRRDNPTIQDVGRGLEVSRRGGSPDVRNELDVAFLANNRLYVIECKTRKFGTEAATGGAGAEALYKLHTLGNILGGLQARRMLVSYQNLNRALRERAEAYRVETCACRELPRLRERLQRWLG